MANKTKVKIYNLLRWSEKYFKTDMVYLAKGGFWLIFIQIVSAVSAFALSIVFANFISKEIYGNYKYVLSLVGLISVFSLTGMNTAVTQAVARNLEGTLQQSFLVQLKWSALPFMVAVIGSLYYFFQGNYILAISLLIAGLLSPISNSANTYVAFLNGKKRFDTLFKYNSTFCILFTVAIILAIFVSAKILWLIFVYYFSQTIFNLFFYYKTLRDLKPNNKTDNQTIIYGKHLSLINVPAIIVANIDKILIFHFLGAVQLAIYYFAAALPEQIKGIFKIVAALALPKLSEKPKKEAQLAVAEKIPKFLLTTMLIILFYIFIAPMIYKIFFPKYLESIFYSQIFAISLIFTAPIIIFTNLMQSQVQIKSLYKFNIASSIIRIIILFLMIYYYGIIGAVLSYSICGLINFVYLQFLVKKIN